MEVGVDADCEGGRGGGGGGGGGEAERGDLMGELISDNS